MLPGLAGQLLVTRIGATYLTVGSTALPEKAVSSPAPAWWQNRVALAAFYVAKQHVVSYPHNIRS